MANLNEVLVSWNVGVRSGFLTVMYFDGTKSAASARTSLNTFLTACNPYVHTTAGWTIQTAGRVIDSATGRLTSAWQDGTAYTGVGTGSGTICADATQILVRWHTLVILDGQRIQGRTFLPGVPTGATSSGNILGTAQTAIQNAGNTFAASANGPVIWHRPHRLPVVPPATEPPPGNMGDGAMIPVSSCTVWSELAVQRRRRG